ncbi:TIGR01440 family protein [Salipaludibacillus sp. CUR1]|uniref:TIGR01440 family protein n=1 Tax=Salipaludibacillus sp. CUR1 TaxID=2820003 RepID=UPI001E2F6B32|nr:TIGR01440 family protein [Salipaludibacillus sp. CUR1]MCE7792465.1 TIGR01440 family protein [Salipaludibacillus sp. CUR1]
MAETFAGQTGSDLMKALDEFQEAAQLKAGQLFVIGASTSEVIGRHIGSAGSEEVAAELWHTIKQFQEKTGVNLAFQCCEHLNRAIVLERKVAEAERLDEVAAVPVAKAGGSMASFVYRQMEDPVTVEEVKAHAGIDIGDTFIGMHLKKVAVPVRTTVNQIGEAHLTLARTRPKLIGGARAVYTVQPPPQK